MIHKRITPILILVLLVSACGGNKNVNNNPNTPPDPLRIIAIQTDRAAEGLNAAIDVKRALFADGLITREQSHAITGAILKVIPPVRALKESAQTFRSFPEGKADLQAIFTQIEKTFNDLQTGPGAIIPTLSETARARINAALAVVKLAIGEMRPLFQ